MEISPLYQILIYLEDKGKATPEDIRNWGISVSRGVLGKMKAMGLTEEEIQGTQLYYKLSKKGFEFLNSILDQIHKGTGHWDGKWRTVWFSITEKQRSKRDKFRRYLEGMGLKPVLNSLWITPLNVKDKLLSYVTLNGLTENVAIVETEQIWGLKRETLLKAWNYDRYRELYNNFIKRAEILTRSSGHERYTLKKMIFEYALILNGEPQLPIELIPNDWPRFRAELYYKKLKRLIG